MLVHVDMSGYLTLLATDEADPGVQFLKNNLTFLHRIVCIYCIYTGRT